MVLALSATTSGQNAVAADDLDMSELSLEELMGIQVELTSVAKKPQDPFKTPAATYILTSEEIRRSGVTSIPEALRLVPGVHVARADSSLWDVGIRGFNAGHSNKLLVLIDGRSVYAPLQAGTFWEVQDTILTDIERIEVIRGPGASVWGANAVNGVINIITKDARDTVGTHAQTVIATDETIVEVRHGGLLGESGAYRVYAKAKDVKDSKDIYAPGYNDDAWTQQRGGFRADWDESLDSTMTVQGDVYSGELEYLSWWTDPANGDYLFQNDSRQSGGNVLSRFTADLADDQTLTVQTYFDNTHRKNAFYEEDRNTFDVEVTHRAVLSDTHDLIVGAGYRASLGDTTGTSNLSFDPAEKKLATTNLFFQDEITVVPETFSITLGSKFEQNSYTGWEVQPTGRFAWTPTDDQTFWGAVSRAVRTPTPLERDGTIAALGIPDDGATGYDQLVAYVPGKDFDVEELTAYELGWRLRESDTWSIDVATFYHDYDQLATDEYAAPYFANPTLAVFPLEADNKMRGFVRGAEITGKYKPFDGWEITSGYTWLDVYFDPDNDSTRQDLKSNEDNEPDDVFLLRSNHDVAEAWEVDWQLFYVSELKGTGAPSYWKGDVRIGWTPNKRTDISVGVRNLFHGGGQESELAAVEPVGYLRATYHF